MGLLFISDPKIAGCGKKTGRGVIWVEKRCLRVPLIKRLQKSSPYCSREDAEEADRNCIPLARLERQRKVDVPRDRSLYLNRLTGTRTGVNFTNIIGAAFLSTFFCQKVTKPNCRQK